PRGHHQRHVRQRHHVRRQSQLRPLLLPILLVRLVPRLLWRRLPERLWGVLGRARHPRRSRAQHHDHHHGGPASDHQQQHYYHFDHHEGHHDLDNPTAHANRVNPAWNAL